MTNKERSGQTTPPAPKSKGGEAPELPPRQKNILIMLCLGMTTQEIADFLDVTNRSVDVLRMRLLTHLDARNTPHAISIAFARGILNSDYVCTTSAKLQHQRAILRGLSETD